MRIKISPYLANTLLVVLALVLLAAPGRAADPGDPLPATSEASDQKAGSILFYNFFTSSAVTPTTQNTRFSITNTNTAGPNPLYVHLFFVDGATCSIRDVSICLTPNETMTLLATDYDPGVTGYLVAVAVDANGCPISHNFLIGDAYVKQTSFSSFKLNAVSIAALYEGTLPSCNPAATTTTLNFDGMDYNRVPRALALDSIPSPTNNNQTVIAINRVGGNLATGAATIGPLFGIVYDDAENPFSFSLNVTTCQLKTLLNEVFVRTVPRLNVIIPAGRTGWLRIYSLDDIGLLGAAFNFNPNTATMRRAFTDGANLHHLTLTSAASYTIPVFAPHCN